jgi:hypothetical protein
MAAAGTVAAVAAEAAADVRAITSSNTPEHSAPGIPHISDALGWPDASEWAANQSAAPGVR